MEGKKTSKEFLPVPDDTFIWCTLHECVHDAASTEVFGDGFACSESDWKQLYMASK